MARKDPKLSKRTEKAVKAIIRKELSHELEEKTSVQDYENQQINAAIPHGLVFNEQGNFYKLLPPITQSTTGEAGRKYNTRIGSEIILKSLRVKGFCSYNYATTGASTNYQNAKLAVRVMIVKAKDYNEANLAFDNMPTDRLLCSDTGVNTRAFNGDNLSSFAKINRDAFTVKYDKVIYLNAPTITYGATSTDTTAVPSANKLWSHTMRFGKKGLKLKFQNTNDSVPNFPYWLMIGYSSCSGVAVPGNALVRMSVQCLGKYTDA